MFTIVACSSIDQITAVTEASRFLGTPLQLAELLKERLPDTMKPLLIKKIELVHDFSSAIKPYLNPNVKFFNLAQYYRFSRKYDFAIMEYMMLRSVGEWSPPAPSDDKPAFEHGPIALREAKIRANLFSMVGGREFFYRFVGIDPKAIMSAIGTNLKLFEQVLEFEKHLAPELFLEPIQSLCADAQDSIDFLLLDDTAETKKEFDELLDEEKYKGCLYLVLFSFSFLPFSLYFVDRCGERLHCDVETSERPESW